MEFNRPRQYHQTIPFMIRGKDVRHGTVTLRWRQIAEKNPHADGEFRQDPIVKPGWMKCYLNDREVPETDLKKTRMPGGRIPSGFKLKSHEVVELTVPGRADRGRREHAGLRDSALSRHRATRTSTSTI